MARLSCYQLAENYERLADEAAAAGAAVAPPASEPVSLGGWARRWTARRVLSRMAAEEDRRTQSEIAEQAERPLKPGS